MYSRPAWRDCGDSFDLLSGMWGGSREVMVSALKNGPARSVLTASAEAFMALALHFLLSTTLLWSTIGVEVGKGRGGGTWGAQGFGRDKVSKGY